MLLSFKFKNLKMSKHYYYYIEAGAAIDCGSRFFRVGIGASKQAVRDYLFLTAHAVSNGFYFERDSVQVSQFVAQIASSLGFRSVADLPLALIDARELVRCIKSNWAAVKHQTYLDASEHQRLMLNADYRLISKLRGLSNLPSGNYV